MMNLGDKMSDNEVDDMIQDAGGSSKIDYVNFVKTMNKKAKAGGSAE
jgi:Ca2+-binding EF-hand superfamily protein